MGLSSILNVVNPLRHIPGLEKASGFVDKLADPLGLFKDQESLGSPTSIQDPNEALRQEATDSAIAGDIAARNARQRSSTLGAGSRFIQQQLSKRPSPENPNARNIFSPHTNRNRLVPGAGASSFSGGA